MSYASSNVEPIDGRYSDPNYPAQPREVLELTPEEVRVIRECSREGVFKRAIPMGLMFGLGGLFGARAGPLMSKSYGTKPAVIGLGLIGYIVGRMTYSSICFRRAWEVPNGNLRKMFPNLVRGQEELLGPTESFYQSTETPKVQEQRRNSHTELDIPSMSQFDTTPSDYYVPIDDVKEEIKAPENYTSYDDLRKQNRQDYQTRLYGPPSDSQRPQPRYTPTRPPQDGGGTQKTKYGDSWE